jgi:hypothetical protein
MNTKTTNQTLILIVSTLLCVAACETSRSQTSTAFTYSGHLSQAGQPANQPHDLTFGLFTAALGGSPVAAVTNANVAVSNGVFITSVDFGPGFFDGTDYWLELGVRPGGTSVDFNILDPRQPITRTPYAFWASQAAEATSAQTAAAVAAGAISRDGLANGAVTTEKIFDGTIALSDLSALAQDAFWRTGGNAGTTAGTHFLGTTDNQALELKVNNRRALRLEYATNAFGDPRPNVIGGLNNTISTYGSHIGGGRDNTIADSSPYSAIGGGYDNNIADYSMESTIAGGSLNAIGPDSPYSAVGGGLGNVIADDALYAVIPGGSDNWGGASYAFAAGRRAKALHTGAFLWADSTDADFPSVAENEFAVRASGGVRLETGGAGLRVDGNPVVAGLVQQSQLAPGAVGNPALANNAVTTEKIVDGTVAFSDLSASAQDAFWRTGGNAGTTAGLNFLGTTDNQALELKVNNRRAFRLEYATDNFGNAFPNLIGGSFNTISTCGSLIGGGAYNVIGADSYYGTVAGGYANHIGTNSFASAIGGGQNNAIGTNAWQSTISGGLNQAIGTLSYVSTIGGGSLNQIADNSFASTIAGGSTHNIGSSSPNSTIGGGRRNVIGDQSDSSTIAGGQGNTIEGSAASATISGGEGNSIRPDASQATISGGSGNVVSDRSRHSAIGGGNLNWIQHDAAFGTIGGGHSNRIRTNAWQATIGGGDNNHVGGEASGGTISGGMANRVLDHATMATIPGGYANQATNLAFAAGYQAQAVHSGAFVWSDGEGTPTASTNANSVTLRARGGYRLLTSGGDTGAFLAAGSGSWSSMSDRASKENFEPVNAPEVLAKVVALPLSTWNYKTQDAATRHLGPTAQDFHATFGVGENDTSITTVDADGVALAAIQGLNQKVEEQKAENAELKKRLADLEQLLSKLNLHRD